MTDVEKKRNGVFTCLDCVKVKTRDCAPCVSKNWELFEINKELIGVPYAEKCRRYELK